MLLGVVERTITRRPLAVSLLLRHAFHSSTSGLPKQKLGVSDLEVTKICLGTMTFGVQVNEEKAHRLLDYAIKERGINFIDTAEFYPVPIFDPSYRPGKTEEIIGNWLAKNPRWRSRLIIATKVAGYMSESSIPPARVGRSGTAKCQLDAKSVKEACEASLRRLQTDYIDLYQLHWPDRYVPTFGSVIFNPTFHRPSVPISETLQALIELIKGKKIRHYGLSNETSFGVCQWVHQAEKLNAPRPVSIQNSYCLLHRSFETELAECCAPFNYNIPLLPWSVLGGGVLSGKYVDDKFPEGARFSLYKNVFQGRYLNESCKQAVKEYSCVADKAGLTLAQLAHAFCYSRWFIGSTIIGGTTIDQLKENIDAINIVLPDATLTEINKLWSYRKDPAMIA